MLLSSHRHKVSLSDDILLTEIFTELKMESLPVRRKSCLLRIRENCPFRKLRRQKYDVSAAASSAIGSYWNSINHPAPQQPISTVYSEPLPPLVGCQNVCAANQSQPDIHMEEEPPAAGNHHILRNLQNLDNLQNLENLQNLQNIADIYMVLDDAIDPETGERAQG